MADLSNLEIARIGDWELKTGDFDFTEAMLRDAAVYANRPDARPAPVHLGHRDPRFDGEPALGWVTNLRVEGSGEDAVLLGDVTGMPDWLVDVAPTAWPDRSVEGWTDFVEGGRTYAFIMDGLGLLGVAPPGMSTIRSLRDLPQALGVAASARICAQMKTPDPHPEAGSTTKKGAGMSLATKYREALAGLPDDASDEDVGKVLAAAGLPVASTTEPPPPPEPPQPTPPAPEQPDEPEQQPQPEAVAAAGRNNGTMVLDVSAWEAMQERTRRLEAEAAVRRRNERDEVIAAAVSEGKFAPSRTEHWQRVWDRDPEGTRQLINGLTRNAVPVMAMGYDGGPDGADPDEEFAHLFPPTRKSKGA